MSAPQSGRHLPTTVSSFIGRELECSAVVDSIVTDRLVTLCGPPGVGKTRLALEAAKQVPPDVADDAWWVDLAHVGSSDAVVLAVARALGVHERPAEPLIDTLVKQLRERRALVVLDNCEHLAEAASTVAQALLEGCPHVRILATSREALGVVGERRWDLPGLGFPGPNVTADEAMASEAFRLFCARASTSSSRFKPGAGDIVAIAEICRQLDGIPLAVELAAARLETLSVSDIAARLDDRFALLGGNERFLDGRHRALFEALEWSYDLLDPPLQTILRAMGVFSAPATLEAVHAVCGGGRSVDDVLDLLTGLVSKSLGVAHTDASPTRYGLIETVRAYAVHQLQAGSEADAATAAHAAWYSSVVEAAEPAMTGPDQVAIFNSLDVDYENVRAALDWQLAQHGDALPVLRMVSALTLYWRVRGRFSEGRECLERALSTHPDAPLPLRAKALWGAGLMALMTGDISVAESRLEESRDVNRQLDDISGQGRALLLLGDCRLAADDSRSAVPLLQAAVDHARRAHDSWCLAHSLATAGRAELEQQHPGAARNLIVRALDVATEARDAQGLRVAVTMLGVLARAGSDLRGAEPLIESSLAISMELQEPYGVATSAALLGETVALAGDYKRADVLLRQAVDAARSVGLWELVCSGLTTLGQLAVRMGDFGAAERLFRDAESHAGSDDAASSRVHIGLAIVAMSRNDLWPARTLLLEAVGKAESASQPHTAAAALHLLGGVEIRDGRTDLALTQVSRALELADGAPHSIGRVQALEAMAELAFRDGKVERATRLVAGAESVRARLGYVRSPREQEALGRFLGEARSALGTEAFTDAWEGGRRMTVSEAVSYALGRRGQRKRPSNGWEGLTRAEREVVRLVVDGLNNPQIAERLLISRNTVKGRLTSVFAKLGVSSRVDLTREALRRRS